MNKEQRVIHSLKRLTTSLKELNKAIDYKRLKTIERKWIQYTPKINIFNYWWYRYFTNELELYILDSLKFNKIKKKK